MNAVTLAWTLLRGGGRKGMLGSVLTLAAVGVTTTLLMFAVAGNFAFADRAERTAWRTPVPAGQVETARQLSVLDMVDGRPMTVVYLTATGSGAPPVPPGMDGFPAPGELWASPELAALLERLPADQLADRFDAPVTGELGDAALVHGNELVAVVGVASDSPVLSARPLDGETVVGISEFGTDAASETYRLYQSFMAVATVLMVVPLLVFGGAAARLTVARRDQRLASLRLVGATPGQVVRVTVAEAILTALVGAVAGAILYTAVMPLLARIPIDGGPWFVADLWPPLWATGAVIVAVPLLVGLSAVVGLRRVVISPLGVARRQTPPGIRAARLLVLVAFVGAFLFMSSRFLGMGALGSLLMLVLLAGVFGAINLVGPWVVSLLGRVTALAARRPAPLLAGRRLVDDPRSAWRTVAGIALTGFVAGFTVLLSPQLTGYAEDRTLLTVSVPTTQVEAVTASVATVLPDGAKVTGTNEVEGVSLVDVETPVDSAAIDRFRTEVAQIAPGSPTMGTDDWVRFDDQLFTDVKTGVLVVLCVSILIAMVSAAVSGASSVLDRRQVYGLLHLSGTPMKVLNSARRMETLLPLAVMGGGSLACGMLMAMPFSSGGEIAGNLALLFTVVGFGVVGVVGASAVSRPLLASVMRNTPPRPD
ncbi:FtsX-like permease family protein [Stackebrandtia albiflava]|uniref:FtsX-like permease family protein n=1 Tax=Stackebrandtia albiflava TaxID=406432 RepID=A0A562V497_9ACTN|nr:FtsX-like permease family protein [Stackebrandtia albiflava]TWJ12706.1 FtsX-like permease family protein [Stackebrandtia albiflava]